MRGDGEDKVLLEDTMAICGPRPLDLITLNAALTKLAELDVDQARLVELRFFAGFSVEEAADVMGISGATVKRSWRSARAFLRREIEGGGGDARAVGAGATDL
jgi:DNA-directed RNA polymerase specialized sigma24 family protein